MYYLLSYKCSYKTHITKSFYGLADKKCVQQHVELLIILWVQNQRKVNIIFLTHK